MLYNLERVAVCRAYVGRCAPCFWHFSVVVARISYRYVEVLARHDVEVAVGDDQASVAAVVVLKHRHVSQPVGSFCRKHSRCVVSGRNTCHSVVLSVVVVVDTFNRLAVLVADAIEQF